MKGVTAGTPAGPSARYRQQKLARALRNGSEEHAWMQVPGGAPFTTGDRVRVVPNHACVTASNAAAAPPGGGRRRGSGAAGRGAQARRAAGVSGPERPHSLRKGVSPLTTARRGSQLRQRTPSTAHRAWHREVSCTRPAARTTASPSGTRVRGLLARPTPAGRSRRRWPHRFERQKLKCARMPKSLHPSNARNAIDVLCPPKPKAFDTATFTSRSWGSLKV